MKDLFRSLRGPAHCPWCVQRDPTWAERLFDGSGPRENLPLPAQVYWWWMDVNYRMKIWRLGHDWHSAKH